MKRIIEEIAIDYQFYIDKINQCAGYFDENLYKKLEYKFDKQIIDLAVSKNISISDFSNHVIKLCDNDLSKLLFIAIFAYNVEI